MIVRGTAILLMSLYHHRDVKADLKRCGWEPWRAQIILRLHVVLE